MAKPPRPHITCWTRNSCTVESRLARSSRRRTDTDPPSTRSTPSAPPAAADRRRRRPPTPAPSRRPERRRAAEPRHVADVRQHAGAQLGSPDRRDARGDDQQTRSGSRADQGSPQHRRHDRIRRSTGNRPIRIISRYATTQIDGSGGQDDDAAGRRVAVDHLGLERHEQQHQPWRRDREASAVDRPGLARLELRAGARVVSQIAGEVAEQPAELAATDLARHPETLDHPVPDRVGEPGLQPVEALAEPTGHLVVQGELVEGFAQRLRSANRQRGQRVR